MTGFQSFSPKQRKVLTWWCPNSSLYQKHAIICDGAVRSGKTVCMGVSFFCWAMVCFDQTQFAVCGKTASGVRRNLLVSLMPLLKKMGFEVKETIAQNKITVRFGGRENIFYLFGGRDESSAALIQGITLGGVLLDEVALMPRSFVEQALARCSMTGSRLWFSCNPEGPMHWFYREWICKADEKNALYLHFTMDDNPGLEPAVKARYEQMFQGAFYRRFVLGEWVAAEGLVYDFFDGNLLKPKPEGEMERYCVSCDYGTVNPLSLGLWGLRNGIWYRMEEYYYDSKAEGRQKTDGEYADELERLIDGRTLFRVVVDPSAASFMEVLRRRNYPVVPAVNEVMGGIRLTAEYLRTGRAVICENCEAAVREFSLYRWDERRGGRDQVRKEYDHAMDEIRYFIATVAAQGTRGGTAAGFVERGRF